MRLRYDNGIVMPLSGNETFVPATTHAGNSFVQKFASELVGQRVWIDASGHGQGTIEQARPPREMTPEEVRYLLIQHIKGLINYCEHEERRPTARDKLELLAFSILSSLDGGTIGLPGFNVVPYPHPKDAEYNRSRGQDWFPSGCDIGYLHEFFHRNPKPNEDGKL